jgi:AcrR family transcriptional regulator
MGGARAPRADAVRNRQRVLAAARKAFASQGPSVSLDDIARQAGVGAGTLHRHFPTKDELLRAVIADGLASLTVAAHDRAEATDPGAAFFDFFDGLIGHARQNLALAAALSNSAGLSEQTRDVGDALHAALTVLLTRAQQAGAVRADVTTTDLHAILAGALTMEQRLPPSSQGIGLRVVVDGLRATPTVPERNAQRDPT